jgi:hypothetical protein
MPDIHQKPHLRWCEWIVSWKLQLGREDAVFEWCIFGSFNDRFPGIHVVLGDWTGVYAWRWVGSEGFVFFEEALGGGGRHFVYAGVGKSEVLVVDGG